MRYLEVESINRINNFTFLVHCRSVMPISGLFNRSVCIARAFTEVTSVFNALIAPSY